MEINEKSQKSLDNGRRKVVIDKQQTVVNGQQQEVMIDQSQNSQSPVPVENNKANCTMDSSLGVKTIKPFNVSVVMICLCLYCK